jgi:hypothetical protein
MKSWIEEGLFQTKEIETPKSFIFWAMLTAISAVVKKNVYLDKGGAYNLYPNIYVMLIAKSGMRKGFATWLAQDLVKQVDNTRIISGQSSIQGALKEIGTTRSNPNGSPGFTTACAFLSSGEFSELLLEDPMAFKTLTSLYDTHYNKEWRRNLKNSDPIILKEPYITILGASNEELFKSAIPDYAYKGGFIARCIIIEETQRRLKNPLTRPMISKIDTVGLSGRLKEISKVAGPFQWTDEARDIYEKWYKQFEPEEKEDPTGTVDRIHDNILKVTMLLSLSKRLDLQIQPDDLQAAFTVCQPMLQNALKVSSGNASPTLSYHRGRILRELVRAKQFKIERAATLRKLYQEMSLEDFDKVIGLLLESEQVKVRKEDGKTWYVLGKAVIEEYQKNIIESGGK